jgi:hypothetical protein
MNAPAHSAPIRDDRVVDLNLVKVRICSNVEDFPAFAYFPRYSAPDVPADYEVHCIDLDRDPVRLDDIIGRTDATLRAKRFRAGYYLVHYFGEPAHLITVGRTFHVFGRALQRTVWPYFVKYILSIHAADNQLSHLKAAGFAYGGGATLLVGGNGSGKTVFLTQACLHGGRFITNTHALLRDGVVYAVPTSIRIRRDPIFQPLIAGRDLVPHMEEGDYLTSPQSLFGDASQDSAPVRNLVIADFNARAAAGLEEIPPADAVAFTSQFGSALTVYGLKDDMLEHHGRDFHRFTAMVGDDDRRLNELAHSVRCYRANVDMTDEGQRDAVLKTLCA